MNNVILIGRLVRDPNIRFLESASRTVGDFTLAVDKKLSRDKKAEMEATGKPTADFIRIVVWGKLAETCGNYLKQGSKVAVEGSISTSKYTKDGETRYSTDIVARSVEFLERVDSNYGSSSSAVAKKMEHDLDEHFPEIDDTDDVPF